MWASLHITRTTSRLIGLFFAFEQIKLRVHIKYFATKQSIERKYS